MVWDKFFIACRFKKYFEKKLILCIIYLPFSQLFSIIFLNCVTAEGGPGCPYADRQTREKAKRENFYFFFIEVPSPIKETGHTLWQRYKKSRDVSTRAGSILRRIHVFIDQLLDRINVTYPSSIRQERLIYVISFSSFRASTATSASKNLFKPSSISLTDSVIDLAYLTTFRKTSSCFLAKLSL